MSQIGFDMVVSSVMVVIMMLVILSVPSILLTVRNSAKLLKKYRLLRSIDIDEKDVPQQLLNEWNAVNSQMAYTTLITDEIEKLSGLKPAIFQCEIAIVLMVILMIIPGCELEVLILMIAMISISVLAVIYGALNTRMYTVEYMNILSEMNAENQKENKTADGMYG